MSTTLTNSFATKLIVAFTVLATLVVMTGVASIAPASAQVITDGALIRAEGSIDIYIVKIDGSSTYKRLILNPAIFNSYGHLSWNNVITVSQATLDSYTTSDLVIEVNADGSVVNGKVWRLTPNGDTGTKQWLNVSASQFEAAGLKWNSIYKINHLEASDTFYATGSAITELEGGTGSQEGINTPGAEGSLTLTLSTTPSAVDIDEGSVTKDVAGFKVEADNSDVRIERVDVMIETDDTTSEKPWTYYDRARLKVDGTVVATKTISSADDFIVTENGGDSQDAATDEYTLRFTNLSSIVRKDGSVNITVELRTIADIDSGNLSQTVNVGIPTNGIRGVDGAGLNVYASTAYVGRTHTVSTNATATLTPALSDDTPDEGYAEVDSTANTEDIEVLRFTLEADEGDVTIDDLPATLTASDVSDAGLDESSIIIAANLYVGSVSEANRLGSEDVPTGGAVTFDNIDYTVDDGDTDTFIITVDVLNLDAALDPGDYVSATVDGSGITGEDDQNNSVSGANVDPASNNIRMYEVFPTFSFVSSSFTITPDLSTASSEADLEIVFDVTAVNGDVYITDQASDTGATAGVEVTVTGDQAGGGSYDLTSNATLTSVDDFKIPNGTTKRFTVAIHILGNGAFAQASISSVFWDTAVDSDGNEKDFSWDDFKTTSKYVADANS